MLQLTSVVDFRELQQHAKSTNILRLTIERGARHSLCREIQQKRLAQEVGAARSDVVRASGCFPGLLSCQREVHRRRGRHTAAGRIFWTRRTGLYFDFGFCPFSVTNEELIWSVCGLFRSLLLEAIKNRGYLQAL